MIVANDISKVTKMSNQIIIIRARDKYTKIKGDKLHLAEKIFDEILKK